MMNWFLNLKIFYKILSIVIVNILIFFFLMLFAIIPFVSSEFVQEKRNSLKSTIEIALSIVDEYQTLVETDALSLSEAQSQAIERIRNIRFDNNNYVWINNLQLIMIMHPTNAKLNGTDISDIRDPDGVRLFYELTKLCKENGEGYFKYSWPKPSDLKKPIPKTSYCKLDKEWGWVLGTGQWFDSIDEITDRIRLIIIFITLGGAIAAILISLFISRMITKPIIEATRLAIEMSKGNLDYKN